MTKTSKTSRRILALVLSGALLVPAMSAAQAGPRDGWHRHDAPRHFRPPPPHHGHGKRHRHGNAGAAAAAGIIGLAAGAILLGAANQSRHAAHPGPVHNPGYQPWSPAWYRYCSAKYRSFKPQTGTYTTYRGEQRFCQ